ncbi:hypothetical protein IQ255_12750 [Pleurocapsales cyanobacterium LEGE 10410]|nr:hypothetical protein [Pleurocapsales cyanobacterium LEGE 10410]
MTANNLSYVSQKVKNLPLKIKREINRLPPVHALKEQAYQKALNYHAQFLPQLDSQSTSFLGTLRNEGTCIIPIEDLNLSSTNLMLNMALSLADQLKTPLNKSTQKEASEVDCHQNNLRELPEILLWALEPKLLDLIENYVGLPILYQGFAIRRSIADGQYSGVRRWHIDWEDRRTVKVIIYLNDVVAGGGPYEYISRKTTSEAIKKLNYNNLGYLSDQEIQKAVPKSDWTACLAPQGSVIITDTSSVFHRAQPPTQTERFSITFCYTSTSPQVMWKNSFICPQQWETIEADISQRQKKCLHKTRFS